MDNVAQQIYLGTERMVNLAVNEIVVEGGMEEYTMTVLDKNCLGLGGRWWVDREHAKSYPGAQLQLNFVAKEVFVVARYTGELEGERIRVKVSMDGKVLVDGEGEDVANGVWSVGEKRAYNIVKLEKAGNHLLKLEFGDGGVEVYVFSLS